MVIVEARYRDTEGLEVFRKTTLARVPCVGEMIGWVEGDEIKFGTVHQVCHIADIPPDDNKARAFVLCNPPLNIAPLQCPK